MKLFCVVLSVILVPALLLLPSVTPTDDCTLTGQVSTYEPWYGYILQKTLLNSIDPSPKVKFEISYPRKQCCIKLLVYFDDQEETLNDTMTCQEREDILPVNNKQIIYVDKNTPGILCVVVNGTGDDYIVCSGERIFRSSKPRKWFFALSRCSSPPGTLLNVSYQFNVTGYVGVCADENNEIINTTTEEDLPTPYTTYTVPMVHDLTTMNSVNGATIPSTSDISLTLTVPTSTPAPASLGPGRSDIACEADSITSFVPVDQLPVGTQLTWRDPACGLTSNGTHLLSTIGHNQCGTTVKITQNSVEFENELIAQSTKSTQSLVDFGDSSFVIPVKCIYPRQTQVATFYQPTQQHVRFYEKRYGHFDVDIVQYKTDKFVTPVQDLGIPRKVPIKSQIYVEAGINDQYSSSLGIHVDQCIATRTPSPSDSVYYSLIKDGCPIIPHVTLYNSTNSKVRFGVEAFRFVTANASDVVYIHCQVSVCDAATPHCAVNCMTSAGRRRRAAAGSGDKTHLLSTGPFMLVVDDQATSLSSSNLVAAISALVAVIACIVAIIGWTRRRHEAVTQPNKL